MKPVLLRLFQVIFLTFYHGKLLLNHHLESIFVIFSKHHEINTSEINDFKPSEVSPESH